MRGNLRHSPAEYGLSRDSQTDEDLLPPQGNLGRLQVCTAHSRTAASPHTCLQPQWALCSAVWSSAHTCACSPLPDSGNFVLHLSQRVPSSGQRDSCCPWSWSQRQKLSPWDTARPYSCPECSMWESVSEW